MSACSRYQSLNYSQNTTSHTTALPCLPTTTFFHSFVLVNVHLNIVNVEEDDCLFSYNQSQDCSSCISYGKTCHHLLLRGRYSCAHSPDTDVASVYRRLVPWFCDLGLGRSVSTRLSTSHSRSFMKPRKMLHLCKVPCKACDQYISLLLITLNCVVNIYLKSR